jgi:hypothetical protein
MTKARTPDEEIRDMQIAMISKASLLIEVASLSAKILANTTKWGENVGVSAAPVSSKVSPEAKKLAKRMDDNCNDAFNTEQWKMIKGLFEDSMGEELPTKKVGMKVAESLFVKGIAVKFIESKHGHKYPLNEVTFVTEPEENKGVDQNGATPKTGYHFDAELTSLVLPTETEIRSALANMYIMARPSFDTLVGLIK